MELPTVGYLLLNIFPISQGDNLGQAGKVLEYHKDFVTLCNQSVPKVYVLGWSGRRDSSVTAGGQKNVRARRGNETY